MTSMIYLLLCYAVILSNTAFASCYKTPNYSMDTPQGYWKTIDDKTGQTKGIVHIFKTTQGTLAGRVIGGIKSNDDPRCKRCDAKTFDPKTGFGLKKNDEPIGKVFMWGYRKNKQRYTNGYIVDNTQGYKYRSSIALVEGGNKLDVTGTYLFFYRTQYWERIKERQLHQLCKSKQAVCIELCK